MNDKNKQNQRKVLFFSHIGVVVVRDDRNETIEVADARRLTQEVRHFGEAAFYDRHGFYWMPPEELRRGKGS